MITRGDVTREAFIALNTIVATRPVMGCGETVRARRVEQRDHEHVISRAGRVSRCAPVMVLAWDMFGGEFREA